MRPSAFLRALAAVALLLAILGAADSASAQGVTNILNPARKVGVRPVGHQPYWISRQDCLDDDILTFNMTLTGSFLGFTLEVWAGQGDCTAQMPRAAENPTCWQVGSASPTNINFSIDIHARDIVAKHLPSSTVPATIGDIRPGTRADCTTNDNQAPQNVSLYFMFVTGHQGTAVGTAGVYAMGYDIWPPDAPTGVTAGSGETRLHLSWTRATAPDILRYDFYCDPPPGQAADAGFDGSLKPLGLAPPRPGLHELAFDSGLGGALGTGGSLTAIGGAGSLGAGGAGGFASLDGSVVTVTDAGTTAVGATCNANSRLVPGTLPDRSFDVYKCGSQDGVAATSGTADGLQNDVQYTVAVVGVDSVDNEGVFSGQVCATPQAVTDFFEFYRQAGGTGGGGLCSIAPPRRGVSSLAMALGAFGAALVVRRRARRR